MKTITRLLVVALVLLSTFQLAKAQDIHFSQFYASPLTLNPAMTGNVAEHYRFAVTYRNQWASIPAPYSTVAASIDASVLGCQLGMDHVGVGLAFFNDKSGDGGLNDLSILGSLAYHKGLDQERRYVLSAGGQFAFKQKSVNLQDLIFEEQISDDLTIDPSAPNMEPVQASSFNYFDFRVGGLFTASPTDRINMYVGGAYYHLSKPGESFLVQDVIPADDNLLDPRMVFHAGGSFFLTENFSLSPSALYMSQTASSELVVGTAFGLHFDQGNRYSRTKSSSGGSGIYLGGWYRVGDAIVFLLGVDYQSFKFGFSYDVNVSGLKEATLNQGAVELSLSFTGRLAECQKDLPLYCPRF